MKTTMLCSLLLILAQPAAALEPIRVHGQVELIVDGAVSLHPGYMEFVDGGFMFVVWDASELPLQTGRQEVKIGYRAWPSIFVVFDHSVSVAVIPSDPLWRWTCAALDGFDRTEPRQVTVTYWRPFYGESGAVVVLLEYTR